MKRYIPIIFLIIFVLISGYILFESYSVIDKRRDDAFIVNIASRQSALIHKYVRDFFYYLRTDKIAPIHKTIKTFEETQKALMHGGAVPYSTRKTENVYIKPVTDKSILKQLTILTTQWDKLKDLAVTLVDDQNRNLKSFETLTNFANHLQEEMNIISKKLQHISDEGLFKQQRIQTLVLVINSILLIVCLALIYNVMTFNSKLEKLVEKKTAQLRLAQSKVLETAKQVGMSEIVTGVLHNVGNVLNSVNVSAECVADQLTNLSINSITKISDMLKTNLQNISSFISTDSKGKLIPKYILELSKTHESQRQEILSEIGELREKIEHIKNIIAVQQSIAGINGLEEEVNVNKLVEQAIQVNESALQRHNVIFEKQLTDGLIIHTDKLKVLQIIINIITNAKDALIHSKKEKKILLSTDKGLNKTILIKVHDNGIGIHKDDQTRIFQYGYTTKDYGHGFGLHNSALAATELGGKLSVESNGLGQGAIFTLEIPSNLPNDKLPGSD